MAVIDEMIKDIKAIEEEAEQILSLAYVSKQKAELEAQQEAEKILHEYLHKAESLKHSLQDKLNQDRKFAEKEHFEKLQLELLNLEKKSEEKMPELLAHLLKRSIERGIC